jgi:hypothetical protein
MNRAAKGARFERMTAELYSFDGWVVVRSAASLGPADLLAMRAGDKPRLVQVKSGGLKRGPWADFRRGERAILRAMAAKAGADAVYYFWPNGIGQPRVFWPHEWPVSTRGEPDYVEDANGCWIWVKSVNKKGYGQLKRGSATSHAHRWYYEQAKGPIPAGLVIDHLCRVRACVNPDHLEPVTNQENIARGALRKLTTAQVRSIRDSDASNVELALEYGVNRSYVWAIRKGYHRRDDEVPSGESEAA